MKDYSTDEDYISCPSHCCPVHGCKYGEAGCPVTGGKVKPEYGHNNGCESCEWDLERATELVSSISKFMEEDFSQAVGEDKYGFSHKHRGWVDSMKSSTELALRLYLENVQTRGLSD